MKNPVAGHTNTYHTYSLDDALAGIAAAGFRYVELSAVPGWTEHVDVHADPADMRRRLERRGLAAVSLSAHSDLTTAEGLRHAIDAVRWTAGFGIPILNTAIGGHAGKEESEKAFLDNVGALAAAAEEAGIIIALEVHGDIMASGRRSLPLLEKIGHPDTFKINYDTGNVEYYAGERAIDDLPLIASHLAHVHLKDTAGGKGVWDFPPLGGGSVDFRRVMEILREANYAGPLSVEIEFRGEPWPSLAEVNEAMRRSHDHLRGLGVA